MERLYILVLIMVVTVLAGLFRIRVEKRKEN